MAKFMVIVKATPESETGMMPSTEILETMGQYNQRLIDAGVMKDGDGLKPSSKGKRVRFEKGETTVIDGPFAETKELVAGYWIWECASTDEALGWLKQAPFDGVTEIELRPFATPEDFGEAFTPEQREREERQRQQIEPGR